jgi:hypothetical protein
VERRGWASIHSFLERVEANSLVWLALSWWQNLLRNSGDDQRRNSAGLVSKRILSQPRSDTHQLHFAEVMGFATAQPILRIDNKTGSSDLPVGRLVDRRVESYF